MSSILPLKCGPFLKNKYQKEEKIIICLVSRSWDGWWFVIDLTIVLCVRVKKKRTVSFSPAGRAERRKSSTVLR